jgi:hypothetical protein
MKGGGGGSDKDDDGVRYENAVYVLSEYEWEIPTVFGDEINCKKKIVIGILGVFLSFVKVQLCLFFLT